MSSDQTPQPMRVLVAWPASSSSQLWRELRPHRSLVEATSIPASAVSAYLSEPGYYHVLVITPEDWRTLSSNARRKFAARVSLLIIGPDPANPADLTDAQSGLYVPAPLSANEVASLLAELLVRLTQSWDLAKCVAHSNGRLVHVGAEPRWPISEVTSQPAPSGKPARASEILATPTMGSGIGIGRINVAGDFVQGGKTVIQADGDQINYVTAATSKLVQEAGGDQVNVNRISESGPKITQTAGKDQVNVNTLGVPSAALQESASAQGPKTCAKCNTVNEANNAFCHECGAPL